MLKQQEKTQHETAETHHKEMRVRPLHASVCGWVTVCVGVCVCVCVSIYSFCPGSKEANGRAAFTSQVYTVIHTYPHHAHVVLHGYTHCLCLECLKVDLLE